MNEQLLAEKPVTTELKCFHCGQPCEETLYIDDKVFCCYGCKTVFEILNANNLCEYYSLDQNPGVSLRNATDESFNYLDEKAIRKKVLTFDSDEFATVIFDVPAIHCVSCIWLLENLQKIEKGILRSEVNFPHKTVTIDFDPNHIKLSRLASLLGSVGYTPRINLDAGNNKKSIADKSLLLKLTIAGFCFGNVMLFSFPEYLGMDESDQNLMRIFSWLNLGLAIPVFVYSGFDYLRSAWGSFRQKQINIDVPIAAGLIALFLRSAYDIITATGPGYMDSFTGLVFFLLIGRWFQGKTYDSLAFDRDFKSYFPLAVNKLVKGEFKPVVIYELEKKDQIRIRNMEIVPADSILLDEQAYIDYSFVTGESKPTKAKQGDVVYAGGRLIGQPVMMLVERKTSQSHLTSLWNHDAFRKVTESRYRKTIDRAARVFTWAVMGIAVATAIYWQNYQPAEMWLVLTSVLMVACPCALALAAPFTYGNMLRVFGRHQLYLKNADVIERMANIDSVVFDKTGTVTHGKEPEIGFSGEISNEQLAAVKLLTSASTHPLSMVLYKNIRVAAADKVSYFKEIPSRGIQGMVNGRFVQVGSAAFVGASHEADIKASNVFVAFDDQVLGYFTIRTSVRKNIKDMLNRLGDKCAALLSGDNEADRVKMAALFSPSVQLLFDQDPHDKLAYIKSLQRGGKKVLMIGDGLNDSGALKQSEVGLAVTDDTGVFTPACDGILYGEKINMLDKFLTLAKSSSAILKIGFGISFFYNAIALTIAVTGHLTPLAAAILMPVSSISVVVFATLAVNFVAKRKLGKLN